MAHRESKRPTAAGTTQGGKGGDLRAYMVRPSRKLPRETSVEDRLESKASEADSRDRSGQPSLGQMTREERHKVLFGE